MREIEVTRRPHGAAGTPRPEHGPQVVSGPVRLCHEGRPFAVLDYPAVSFGALTSALLRVKLRTTARTNGLVTTTRPFGFSPRNVIRADYCRVFDLANEDPAANATLIGWARVMATLYRRHVPEIFDSHSADVRARFRDEYLIGGPFTSGNINRNVALGYHYDKGNTKGGWSAMTVIRKGCSGGDLVLPEYGVRLALRTGAVLLFNGAEYLHGVTPCEATARENYRFSVVYYTSEQVWQCLPPDQEIKRIQAARTTRERARQHVDVYAGAKPELTALARKRQP